MSPNLGSRPTRLRCEPNANPCLITADTSRKTDFGLRFSPAPSGGWQIPRISEDLFRSAGSEATFLALPGHRTGLGERHAGSRGDALGPSVHARRAPVLRGDGCCAVVWKSLRATRRVRWKSLCTVVRAECFSARTQRGNSSDGRHAHSKLERYRRLEPPTPSVCCPAMADWAAAQPVDVPRAEARGKACAASGTNKRRRARGESSGCRGARARR